MDLLQMLSQEFQIVKQLDLLPQHKMVVIKLKKNHLNLLKLNQQQHLEVVYLVHKHQQQPKVVCSEHSHNRLAVDYSVLSLHKLQVVAYSELNRHKLQVEVSSELLNQLEPVFSALLLNRLLLAAACSANQHLVKL